MDLGDKDKEGINFMKFLNIFSKIPLLMKFFPNICANLTSEEDSRKVII